MEDKAAGENSCMFLLRCWKEPSQVDGDAVWHFSLVEAAGEQHRKGFYSLEAAMSFIQSELSRLAE